MRPGGVEHGRARPGDELLVDRRHRRCPASDRARRSACLAQNVGCRPHEERLEDAVADREAVVVEAHGDGVGLDERAVEPHRGAASLIGAPRRRGPPRADAAGEATASRRLRLELGLGPLAVGVGVPGDAAAGAEVQLGRPRPRTCGWRRSGRPRPGRRRPSRWRRSRRPAATGSSRAMCSSGGQLGRAGHRARRERGVDQLGPPDAGAQPPSTVLTRWIRPGVVLHRRAATAPAPSPARTPGRGRCGRGRRSSRSRPGPWPGSASAGGGGALDGRGPHPVALAAEEPLRRGGGHAHARPPAARTTAANGAGLPTASAAPRAAHRRPSGGQRRRRGRRVRFTW